MNIDEFSIHIFPFNVFFFVFVNGCNYHMTSSRVNEESLDFIAGRNMFADVQFCTQKRSKRKM